MADEHTRKREALKRTSLGLLLMSALALLAPAAIADYAECLGGPRQTDTLRNPLVPGAPSGRPGQIAYAPEPPALGHGSCPAPVIPGDLGGPARVPSGYSDPTHGSFFPAGGSQGAKMPYGYMPGHGRYPTQSGYQQGMYDWGQGARYGQGTYDYGSSNAGMGTYEPGWGNWGQRSYDWGQGIWGQTTYQGNNGNYGQRTYEQGAQLNGMPTYDTGAGNGGMMRYENGGGNYGQRMYDSGAGNGGSQYYSGKSMGGGSVLYDNGQGNGGTKVGDGGAGNGGTKTNDFGTQASGNQIVNNGGTRQGSRGQVNNGGPRSDAEQTGDNVFAHDKQGNNYDFQGPLPTVRTFSRYLVILGVVIACVWVAMAAISVVMGNRNGPERVVGAVAGLLLLLAGYTIWKIVQMNTFKANTTGVWSNTRGQAQQRQQNGPVNPPQNFAPPEDPGPTTPAPRPGANQMDQRQRTGPNNYRPQGPYTGHPIGPNLVNSYDIPSVGAVPEPPESPVINPNR